MTTENAKLEELLEWVIEERKSFEEKWGEVDSYSLYDSDLIEKIQSLMNEPTPEQSSTVAENATVEPSDWQVLYSAFECINRDPLNVYRLRQIKENDGIIIDRNNCGKHLKRIHVENIDAERRELNKKLSITKETAINFQAYNAELKAEIEDWKETARGWEQECRTLQSDREQLQREIERLQKEILKMEREITRLEQVCDGFIEDLKVAHAGFGELQAENERLKQTQNRPKGENMHIQSPLYNCDVCDFIEDNRTIYEYHNCAEELKKKLAELKAELAERNAEKDPWCYDFGLLSDIYQEYLFWIEHDDFRISTYDILLSGGLDPKGWMPIPEPKGVNS